MKQNADGFQNVLFHWDKLTNSYHNLRVSYIVTNELSSLNYIISKIYPYFALKCIVSFKNEFVPFPTTFCVENA